VTAGGSGVTQSHTVNSELTVTVHSDGTVTWSSAYPMSVEEVRKQIARQRCKSSDRVDELERLWSMVSAPPTICGSSILEAINQSYPQHPDLKITTLIGVVYVELAHELPPKDSSPYIATIASALEAAGYSCTRSRTRVTVRAHANSLPEREPDFVCTRYDHDF